MTAHCLLVALLAALAAAGLALWSAGARAAGAVLVTAVLVTSSLVWARAFGARSARSEGEQNGEEPRGGSVGLLAPRGSLPAHATDRAERAADRAAAALYEGEPWLGRYSPRRFRRAHFRVDEVVYDGAKGATVTVLQRGGEVVLQVRPRYRHFVVEASLAEVATSILWLRRPRPLPRKGTPA